MQTPSEATSVKATGHYLLPLVPFAPGAFKLFRGKLVEEGYPVPGTKAMDSGGGGNVQLPNGVIFGGTGIGSNAQVDEADKRMVVGGGSGGLMVGYTVYETTNLRVYPMLVLGGWGINGVLLRRQDGKKRFAPAKDSPIISAGGPMLRIGFGVELRIPLSKRFRFMIGVQAGFTLAAAPPNRGQATGNVKLVSLPANQVTGPFVNLLIGSNFNAPTPPDRSSAQSADGG